MKTLWAKKIRFYTAPAASIDTPRGGTVHLFVDSDDGKFKYKTAAGTLVVLDDSAIAEAILAADNAFTGTNSFSKLIKFAPGVYDAVAHAGGGQADATALTGFYNTVATVATAGDSCKLPAALVGQMMIVAVAEDAAAAMDLFPATGGKINGETVNAAISLAPGTIAFCSCDIAGNWVVKLVYQKASPFKYLAYKGSADSVTRTTSGALVTGKTYVIVSLVAGDDFTNVGYVADGTPFVATGTTPTAWTEETVVFNLTDIPTITTYASNFVAPITVGYIIGASSVTLKLVSSAEFSANFYVATGTLTYIDESNIGIDSLPIAVAKLEIYP